MMPARFALFAAVLLGFTASAEAASLHDSLKLTVVDYLCQREKITPERHQACLEGMGKQFDLSGSQDISGLDPATATDMAKSCAHYLRVTPKVFDSCMQGRIRELGREGYRVNIAALSPAEQQTVEKNCYGAKAQGPGYYNQCLREEVARLKQVTHGQDELLSLDYAQKAAVREVCELEMLGGKADAYQQCLVQEAGKLTGRPTLPRADAVRPPPSNTRPETAQQLVAKKQTVQSSLQFIAEKPLAQRASNPALPPMPQAGSVNPLAPEVLYAKAAPSVFVVVAGASRADFESKRNLSLGSAVAIGPQMLLTNCHVVKDKPIVLLAQDRKVIPAEIALTDWAGDQCVLTSRDALQPIAGIRPFGSLKVGERVYTLGSPSGLERTFTDGMISGLRDTPEHGHVVQISAPISPGSSGGALLDASGNLVGITTFGLDGTGQLNFAIAAEEYWK